MNQENMVIYNQVRTTPDNAKKAIENGKLKGKTDINPMFRIETLTNVFGPVGIGWYFDVLRIEHLTIPETQEIACFVDINLFYKWNGEWSKPVFGTGGSMLLENFRNAGLKTNDDGYKMALTDAISVAAKELGVSADVYWAAGESKYSKPPMESVPVQNQKINQPAKVSMKVSPDELKQRLNEIKALQEQYKVTGDTLKQIALELKCKPIDEQTAQEYADFLVGFQNRIQ